MDTYEDILKKHPLKVQQATVRIAFETHNEAAKNHRGLEFWSFYHEGFKKRMKEAFPDLTDESIKELQSYASFITKD